MADLEEAGFRRMLRLRGRDLKNLRTGAQFKATVNRIGDLILATELGEDPRADAAMELMKVGAPEVSSQDQVQDLKTNEKWNVVRQKFDCPHYANKYELKQIVAGLDS